MKFDCLLIMYGVPRAASLVTRRYWCWMVGWAVRRGNLWCRESAMLLCVSCTAVSWVSPLQLCCSTLDPATTPNYCNWSVMGNTVTAAVICIQIRYTVIQYICKLMKFIVVKRVGQWKPTHYHHGSFIFVFVSIQ